MDDGAILYRRFLEGDESAFDEIVDSLFHKLVFFIYGYVHDTYAAEDIAIDALSDLFVNKKHFNFKVSLKTCVFMIGKSKALNYLKHQKMISANSFYEVAMITDDEKELEDMIIDDERKRLIHTALKQLPSNLQMVIHLVFFENMSYEEAAKTMNKSKKQIYNLIYRAKEDLRDILESEGEPCI